MVNNFRIFDTNLCFLDNVSVVASTEVVTLPGTNILSGNRRKVWRSTGTAQQTLTLDLGDIFSVNSVGLISSNIGTAGTITILANTSDSWGTPAFNSGTLTPYNDDYTNVLLYYFSGTQSYRYWRITLNDPTNADGYYQLGVAWLGTYISFERNLVYGWDSETIDLSNVEYAVDGTPYTDVLGSYKIINLTVNQMSEGWVFGTMMPLMKTISGKKDVLLAIMPERAGSENPITERNNNYFGRIIKQGPLRNNNFQKYTWAMTFREST